MPADWICSQCGEWHSDHPSQRGPVQDESGALDPIDAAGMAEVEGRVSPLPPYAHRKTAAEQGGASS